jgi:hypothetical protein
MMMKRKRLLVVSLSGTILAGLIASCTYDYFVDETNYKIFVPEVANGTVTDCHVAVYDEAGKLVKARQARGTDNSDPRVTAGLFSFRLPPGNYVAYCHANVGEMQLVETGRADQSFVAPRRITTRDNVLPPGADDNAYALPSEMVFQKLAPAIGNRFEHRVDTTALARYVGRITVRFKNIPVPLARVARARLEVTGAATLQYFNRDTLTSRFTTRDYLFDEIPLSPGSTGSDWEIDRCYFPSIEGEVMRLDVRFFDDAGALLGMIPVEVVDIASGRPLPLLHGRRIILELDTYTVVRIGLVGWDEDIKNSDREV